MAGNVAGSNSVILFIGIFFTLGLFFLNNNRLRVLAKDPTSSRFIKILKSQNNEIFIYDDVYGKKSLSVLSQLATRHAPFDFIYPEKLEGMKSNDNGNLHWVANFSPKEFAKSKIWKTLIQRLPTVFGEKRYYPYQAQSILINRGDFPTVQKGYICNIKK